MLSRLAIALLVAWTGVATLNSAWAAEAVFPPGMRIGLVPPGDLTVSKQFAGFEDVSNKVAITILDLPGRAYEDIQRSLFAKDQKAVAAGKRESFPFAGGIGILLTGRSEENGVTLHKWFLLATAVGGKVGNLTTLVSVQVPESAYAVYSDAVIRKTLASVTFRPRPLQEQLGLLPFKFNDLAGFRVTQVLQTGGAILIDGPSDDMTLHPYIIVSVAGGAPANPADRDRFARDILATAPLRDLKIQLAEPMRISGLPGYEIRAQAIGPRNDAISVVQWLRFAGNGYMRIIGVTPGKDWNEMFTRFRAVRDGVELR